MSTGDPTQLPIDQQLASQDWKVRVLAYDSLLSKLPSQKQEILSKYANILPRFLTEITPAAMEKGIQIVAHCLDSDEGQQYKLSAASSVDFKSILKHLVEKIYVSGRQPLFLSANKVLCSAWANGDKQQAVELLNESLASKNPKVQIASMTALKEVLSTFGPKEANWSSSYQKVMARCSEANPAVRTAALDYLKELGRHQGKNVLSLFKTLKPVQLSEIENHIATCEPPKLALEGGGKAASKEVGGNQVGGGNAILNTGLSEAEIWEQLPEVKVIQKFSEAWTEKVLSEPKWIEKKEKLEVLDKALNVPKIEPANYTHITKMIKKLLTESSIPVHMCCFSILKKLCKGLRKNFSQGFKSLNRSLLLKLKDRKPLVTDSVMETISEGLQCVGLEDVIDEFKDQLKEKNPFTKTNILTIICQHIQSNGAKCVKNQPLCKSLVGNAKENLNDGAPEVRKASMDILVALLKCAPKDPLIQKELGTIEEKKRKKIIELASSTNQPVLQRSDSKPTLQRSPTQESLTQATVVSPLKKSQSVSKYPVSSSREPVQPAGKKSLSGKFSQPPSLAPKVSQSSNQPSATLIIEEMKPSLAYSEAIEMLSKEYSLTRAIIEKGEKGAWKDRVQSLAFFKDKKKDSKNLIDFAEAAMVVIKKWSGDYKETNPIIVKEVLEVAEELASVCGAKAAHSIVEMVTEKAQTGKFDDQIATIINHLKDAIGLRKLVVSILANTKDKSSNPKILSSSLSTLKNLISDSSNGMTELPLKELSALASGALQNPNPAVRQAAAVYFASLLNSNPSSQVLQAALSNLPLPQRKQVQTAQASVGSPKNSQTASKSEDEISQLIQKLKDGLGVPEVLLSAKKHKKEFEKVIPTVLQILCGRIEEGDEIVNVLRGLHDLFGSLLSNDPCFKSLTPAIRNEVLRTPVLSTPGSMDQELSFGTERQSFTKIIATDMNLEALPQPKPQPMNLESFAPRPAPTPVAQSHILNLKPSPLKPSQYDANSSFEDQNGDSQTNRDKVIRKSKPSTPTISDQMQQSVIPHQWKEHKIDPHEPRDSEILELRNMLKIELGADLTERMFSFEKSRVSEAILKVETRMKQKNETAGFWELALKWIFIRVYDCSRDQVLKEFSKMVSRLISFVDRGGKHFTEGEASLIFHILARLVTNEFSPSVQMFAPLFAYHLLQEHSACIIPLLLSHLCSQTLRHRPPLLSLISAYLSALKPQQVFPHVMMLVEDIPTTFKLTVQAISPEDRSALLEYANSNPAISLKVRETLKSWVDEAMAKDKENNATGSKLRPQALAHLESLIKEMADCKVNSDLKNLVSLKKIVEVTKVGCSVSEDFIAKNTHSILHMLTFMIEKHLPSNHSFEAKIADIDSNFDYIRTMLEYIQKISGSSTLLKNISQEEYCDYASLLCDKMVTADSDKRRLEANAEGLFSEKLSRSLETISKFLNSAVLRILEGPPNMVFDVLFELLRITRQRTGQHPEASKKLKIIVKCLVKLSKSVESTSEASIPDILNCCMEYMSLFPTYEEIEKEDLGVKTVKTILNDFCQVFGDSIWDHYAHSRPFPPSDGYVKKWITAILANGDNNNDDVSILSGRRSILKLGYKNPQPEKQALDQRPVINTDIVPHHHDPADTTSDQPGPQPATPFPQPHQPHPSKSLNSQDLPLPSPSMPFKRVDSRELELIKGMNCDQKDKGSGGKNNIRKKSAEVLEGESAVPRKESFGEKGKELLELKDDDLVDVDLTAQDQGQQVQGFNHSFGEKVSKRSVDSSSLDDLRLNDTTLPHRIGQEAISLGKRSAIEKSPKDEVVAIEGGHKRKVSVQGKFSVGAKAMQDELYDLNFKNLAFDSHQSPVKPALASRQIFAANQNLQNTPMYVSEKPNHIHKSGENSLLKASQSGINSSLATEPVPLSKSQSPDLVLAGMIHNFSQCPSSSLHSMSLSIKAFIQNNNLGKGSLLPHLSQLSPFQRNLLLAEDPLEPQPPKQLGVHAVLNTLAATPAASAEQNQLSMIYQRLAQIRERYAHGENAKPHGIEPSHSHHKQKGSHDFGQSSGLAENDHSFIPVEEREKKISEFKEKIQLLLKQRPGVSNPCSLASSSGVNYAGDN